MKTPIMFLLGSGISISTGFPTTAQITSQIFSGNNIIRHTDSRYYISNNSTNLEKHSTNKDLSLVLLLLRIIKEVMKSYDKKELIHYEILYYFVQQLHDFESGEYLNMALYPFIEEVKQRLQAKSKVKIRFIEIFAEAENYIRHTVWHMLNNVQMDNHTQLSFLSDAANDNKFVVNIASLNHDLLIEKHFADKNIPLSDGFGSNIKGVRYWENLFGNKNNLLKIHGSVNWFTLQPDIGNWFDEKIGIVLNGDIDHAKSRNGKMMRSMPVKEPKILVGTFNKIYEYSDSIFSDIYYQFRKLLKNTSILVVSGYSFGDKGVNSAILEWLYTNKKNKIIVINRNPDRLLNITARGAIRKAFRGIAKENFVKIIKQIENTSWKDIYSKI